MYQAMHISNGIVENRVALLFGGVAIAGLVVCFLVGRRALDDRLAPMAGLVAAFVFAAQMVNFPVLPGVSGHVLGGVLAATLVGPYLGAICVAIVLLVQALVFSDGGVTALGLNITNMALVGSAVGYLVVVALRRVLPLAATVVIASVFSVVASSQMFVFEYWLGGGTPVGGSLGAIAATLAGSHVLIGVGEGLITAATVGYVARVRPDLVYALRRRPALDPQPRAVSV